MEESDIPPLESLLRRLELLASPPGLFHATRVRLDGHPAGTSDVGRGWEEFLGTRPIFAASCVETNLAPAFQQFCYWGNQGKLDDYTGLATECIAKFPADTPAIHYHHRDAQHDRDQWTLHLYRFVLAHPYDVAFEHHGTGSYRKFGISQEEALEAVDAKADPDRHAELLTRVRDRLRKQRGLPRFLYGALTTDLGQASAAAVRHLLEELRQGHHRPIPGAWAPDHNASIRAYSAKAATTKDGSPSPESQPSEANWTFYPGGFTVFNRAFKLSGASWKLLKPLALARRPVQPGDLKKVASGEYELSDGTLRGYLTNLRSQLRSLFRLPPKFASIASAFFGSIPFRHRSRTGFRPCPRPVLGDD